MDKKTSNIITKSTWLAIVFVLILYFLGFKARFSFLKCENWYDYYGIAGIAIASTVIIMTIYNKWLWSINLLDSTPRLKGSYSGELIYDYNGQHQRKNINVEITQTYLNVSVKIITNEIASNTITSDLIEENGEYVLYYTYLTNPSSQFSTNNPIQHGTCRLIQTDKNKLEGQYWTSRKTIGDISLTKRKQVASCLMRYIERRNLHR